ncbi:MAG: hypothetical protein HKM95_03145 [Inquilinus sp.]|nr:hypothetical protein [Inquilinus sp.]
MRGLALCLALLLSATLPVRAEGEPAAYSIQVRAVPLAEQEDGLATLQQLKDRGYLVYGYRAEIDGSAWLRIAVGAFQSRGAAAEYGLAFSAAEGMEHFVAAAPVLILPGAGERDFVVTPSALWVRGGDSAREVFVFDATAPNESGLPAMVRPTLSPDWSALAFVDRGQVHAAHLNGDRAIPLHDRGSPVVEADAEFPWHIGWSPSSRYVAFLDQPFWEHPIGLWLARADGTELRCLFCAGSYGARWFLWHPTEDRVLFVKASAHGHSQYGGTLISVDPDGAMAPVAAAAVDRRQEFVGPLRIEDGQLHFRLFHYDDSYQKEAETRESLPIDAL